jgi:hypothetical protein
MTSTLLDATLVRADRVRSFRIGTAGIFGWEAAEHEDQRVVQLHRHLDWHRVEQTLVRFTREIAELREQGWHDV